MTDTGVRLAIVAAAGLALGLGGLYAVNRARQAGAGLADAAGAIGTALNPLSPDNVAYRSVNAVGGAVAGRDYSLGADIRDAAEGAFGATGYFAIDALAYPVNLVVRAVKESARSTSEPEPYVPPSPFQVGA